MGDAASVLMFASFVFCIGWVVWVITNSIRRKKIADVQREMQAKLFDKFATGQEVVAYLNSDAGAKFLDSATIERTKPFGRVLGSIQAGLILFLLGIAMLFVRFTMPHVAFNAIEQANNAHAILGLSFLLMALGLGFLASAGVSYKLSKTWGLFDRELSSKR